MKTILVLALIITGSVTAWNKQEISECHTWHDDMQQHNITVERWQIDQCAAHNIEISTGDSYTYLGGGKWAGVRVFNGAHFEN